MNILLIEDEKKIAAFIKKGLKEQSYNVDVAYDGIKGQHQAELNDYDVIVLDIMLPGQDGWRTCSNIRESGNKTPILMLTSLGQTEDKVKGLNMGADDYLSKPFEFKEFLARVRALERRNSRAEKQSVLKIDDLIMDTAEHTVFRNNTEISLTAKEFALLEYLVKNKKRVMTRTQISESVWGLDFDRGSNVVDTYIKFLRQKIDKGFSKPLIHTVIGVGYVMREEK
ncbi:MAG: response regulator transcription factor [Ignavibacteria bacterium]|nr:response regulator transcription factor [Ignavibacteria bacterium]